MDTSILNSGLAMAMEFGEYWLEPIQRRLGAQHPDLNPAELDAYNKQCQSAMRFGHRELPSCWRSAEANEQVAFSLFNDRILSEYPWVSADNLSRLFSQSCYYAWKDGALM